MTKTVEGRLYTLDGMRGLAAICVAVYHCEHTIGYRLIPGGYLAVDFFFALSGLVIGRAYASRLNEGLSATQFIKMRFVRLYPMYTLGLVLGAAAIAAGFDITASSNTARSTLLAIIPNVAMLPSLSTSYLYPANAPSWSLFFEIVANALFGIVLHKLSTKRLALIALASFAGFYAVVHVMGSTNLGTSWDNALGGFARVMWSFTIGIIIARFCKGPRRTSISALFIALGAIAYLAMVPIGRTDFLFIFVISPFALVALSRIEVSQRIRRLCEALGDISYPLYATHFPLLALAHVTGLYFGLTKPTEMALFLFVAITLSIALVRIDASLRKHLSSALRLRSSAKPQVI